MASRLSPEGAQHESVAALRPEGPVHGNQHLLNVTGVKPITRPDPTGQGHMQASRWMQVLSRSNHPKCQVSRAHLDLAVAGGPGCWPQQMAVPLLMHSHVCDSLLGAYQGPRAWSAGSSLSEELHGWDRHTCRDTKQVGPAQHQAQKDGSTKCAAQKRAAHAQLRNNLQGKPRQHRADSGARLCSGYHLAYWAGGASCLAPLPLAALAFPAHAPATASIWQH